MDPATRVALVTGAGTGIGAAIAQRLAADGYAVAVNGRDPGDADATLAAIEAAGGTAAAAIGDVSAEDDVRRVVAGTVERFGRLDVAVNNAGFSERAPFLDVTLESWNAQLAVDLTGVFLVSREAARHMARRGSGVIVNISSVHEHRPWPRAAAYCAAKAGVGMLTACAGQELAEHGIRVVAVAPGAIGTRSNLEKHGGLVSDEVREQVPAGRMGTPEEVAAAVAWLAGPEAAYVTGTTLVVDGGFETYGPSV